MQLKHKHLSLLLVAVLFFLNISTRNPLHETYLKTDLFPRAVSFCTAIEGNASFRDAPKGFMIRTLEEGYPVVIESVFKDWVEVTYSPEILNMEMCDRYMPLDRHKKKTGFVHKKYLPDLSLLNHNSIPSNKDFHIHKKESKVGFLFKKEVLHTIDLLDYEPSQRNLEFQYYFIYTGIKEYPYLFLYTGWKSTSNMDSSAIVLFGHQKIMRTFANEGKTTICEYKGIDEKGRLLIEEEFLCNWTLRSNVGINSYGTFKDELMINSPLINLPEIQTLQSNLPIIFTLKKQKQVVLETGSLIVKFQLLKYNKSVDLIEVLLNEDKVWVDLNELLVALPIIKHYAGCE